MLNYIFSDFGLVEQSIQPVTLYPFSQKTFEKYLRRMASKNERRWLNQNFESEDGAYCDRPTAKKGRVVATYAYVNEDYVDGRFVKRLYDNRFVLTDWPTALPSRTYTLAENIGLTKRQKQNILFGWGACSYDFTKYKSTKTPKNAFLRVPTDTDISRLKRELTATYFAQDLINEPSNVMNCEGMTQAALKVARKYGAKTSIIKGKSLEDKNYPLIHAVGRASREEPRLIDIRWGDPDKPSVVIVGKGVVFDAGGMNLKDEEGMRHMKYDMAGAAHALGIAYMVMDANLPIHLRVLLPVVENTLGPKAYKQGDVLKSRKGITIEVVNTDAEGRLILADSLYEAAHPTVPGARRPDFIMAMGTTSWHGHSQFPDWGVVHANKPFIQNQFMHCAYECQEYFTARPLIKILRKELVPKRDGPADLLQCVDSHERYDDLHVFNFLHIMVENGTQKRLAEPPFVYTDLSPWRESFSPAMPCPEGPPEGAFAQGIRTAYRLIEQQRFFSGRRKTPQPSF